MSIAAFAEDPAKIDSASQEALEKTQQLLNDKDLRREAIGKNPKAIKADGFLNDLTGGDSKLNDEIYFLASEVFTIIVNDAGGDVQKMNEALASFSRDPSKFAEKWTPEQRAKLRELSSRLPGSILKP